MKAFTDIEQSRKLAEILPAESADAFYDMAEPKKIDADKVIEWLNDQACLGWIEDVEVEKFVEQFKEDFGLC